MINIKSNVNMLKTLVTEMEHEANVAAVTAEKQEYCTQEILDLCEFLQVEIELIKRIAETHQLEMKISKLESENKTVSTAYSNLKTMLKRMYARQ